MSEMSGDNKSEIQNPLGKHQFSGYLWLGCVVDFGEVSMDYDSVIVCVWFCVVWVWSFVWMLMFGGVVLLNLAVGLLSWEVAYDKAFPLDSLFSFRHGA